jgi:hypothetical protein
LTRRFQNACGEEKVGTARNPPHYFYNKNGFLLPIGENLSNDLSFLNVNDRNYWTNSKLQPKAKKNFFLLGGFVFFFRLIR